jgi:hypothetical protein
LRQRRLDPASAAADYAFGSNPPYTLAMTFFARGARLIVIVAALNSM